MTINKPLIFFTILFVQSISICLQAEDSTDERRRNTLRYGTETEIATLIQTLRSEKNSTFDNELILIAENSKNRNIVAGLFNFFGELEKKGLEDRAMRAIDDRDNEPVETILAAIDYLGRVNAVQATGTLQGLIRSGESRFLINAFRALGRSARGHADVADEAAQFLLDHYNNRNPSNEEQQEIITALGETKSQAGVSFLSALIKDTEERVSLRIAALEAVLKIGDIEEEEALAAVIEAASSSDPNIRSQALASLAPFSGDAAEAAILEGFRDSFFRSRIGAAQAAGQRKLESAIPFLRFRAENDEVVAVREAAIRGLGSIHSNESQDVLNALFSERNNSDTVRVLAAEMLVRNDADTYSTRVVAEMDNARSRNQTALYNGFVRVLTTARSSSLESLARRFISAGSVIEKSLALDLILNNEFRHLADEVRVLLDERRSGAGLARKARSTLEALGLEIEASANE